MGVGRPGILPGIGFYRERFSIAEQVLVSDGQGGGARDYTQLVTGVPGEASERYPANWMVQDVHMRQHRFATVILSAEHVPSMKIGYRLINEYTWEVWQVIAVSKQYPIYNLTCYDALNDQSV